MARGNEAWASIQFDEMPVGWSGQVACDFPESSTTECFIYVQTEDPPSPRPLAALREFPDRYHKLWPAIGEALRDAHPDLDTIEAVREVLKPLLVINFLETDDLGQHPEIELVYQFDLPGEGSRGFFVTIRDWSVAQPVMAE